MVENLLKLLKNELKLIKEKSIWDIDCTEDCPSSKDGHFMVYEEGTLVKKSWMGCGHGCGAVIKVSPDEYDLNLVSEMIRSLEK
jgi:hypothetical protein